MFLKDEHRQVHGTDMDGHGWSFVPYPLDLPQQQHGKFQIVNMHIYSATPTRKCNSK